MDCQCVRCLDDDWVDCKEDRLRLGILKPKRRDSSIVPGSREDRRKKSVQFQRT